MLQTRVYIQVFVHSSLKRKHACKHPVFFVVEQWYKIALILLVVSPVSV